MRKLYRARDERMIGGVCGGLARYLGMDPTIVRLLFVLSLFVIPGAIPGLILIYLALLLVVPEETVVVGMESSETAEVK
ncbi:MAG: PspC domain-containing protein [Chloroflexi bacterium]|nr:PspC domain-containing protein [Chloroflexota bacterium]